MSIDIIVGIVVIGGFGLCILFGGIICAIATNIPMEELKEH